MPLHAESEYHMDIYSQGKNAVSTLMRIRQCGSYHIIRDPDGVVSMWAIEGEERGPFKISFADRGWISGRLEDMSPEFVRAFVGYVKKAVPS